MLSKAKLLKSVSLTGLPVRNFWEFGPSQKGQQKQDRETSMSCFARGMAGSAAALCKAACRAMVSKDRAAPDRARCFGIYRPVGPLINLLT